MIVLIVSEDSVCARRLEQVCRKMFDPESTIVRVMSGQAGGAAWADEALVDLLLLDLNLRGPDAEELLARSAAGPFHTVVVSPNVEHARKAFEFGVVDFVPKPVAGERLIQALRRATDQTARAGVAVKFLAVKKSGGIALVPVADLLFLRRRGYTTKLGLADGSSESHDKPLDRLESILPPVFERINEDCLVRLSAIREWRVVDGEDGEVELANGVRLFLAASYHADLREKLFGETSLAR